MSALIQITHPDQLARKGVGDWVWPSNSKFLEEEQPDTHWCLTNEREELVAQCSLWWKRVPSFPNQRIGIIGHYAGADAENAARLLRHACSELQRQGCTMAIGPMDENTWRTYRLVTDAGDRPPFFLEPRNPADWPHHWENAGFSVVAEYQSRLNADLTFQDERALEVAERFSTMRVRLRPLAMERFEMELERIHPFLTTSFRNGAFFTPMPFPSFRTQFLNLRPLLVPELVTIAEQDDRIVGLLFAIPDILQRKAGGSVDTAIIKTLAISSERCFAGLGSVLTEHNQSAARRLGFQRIIHALMHQSSKSQNISARYGDVFRRYALFGRAL